MHFIILGLAAVLLATLALRVVCVFPLQPVKTAPRSLSDQQRSAALRMEADVRAIASVPHNLDHVPALEAAALYIEHELRAAGLLPKIQAFAVGKHTVRNIEVVFEPTAPATAVSLVVGAHYDSAGDSPGANDNGSGVAALLEICRSFALEPPAVSRRVRLVFFVNEEYPHGKTDAMGALRHARALKESGERVAGMIALETLGYFSDPLWLLWFMVACSVSYALLIQLRNWPFTRIPMPWGGILACLFCAAVTTVVTQILASLVGSVFADMNEALTYAYMGTHWSFVIALLFGFGLDRPYLWAGQKTPGSWEDVD